MRTAETVVLCAVLAGGAAVCAAAPAKVTLPRCRVVGAAVGGAEALPQAVDIGGAVTGVVAMGEAYRCIPVDTRVAGVGTVPAPVAAGFGGGAGRAVDGLTGAPSIGIAGGRNDAYGGLGLLDDVRDMPAVGVLVGNAGPSLTAPACTGLVALARMPVSGPVLAGMAPARKQRWDLTEGLPEVSRWCVLGELGVRANQEADDAAYQRLTVDYWKTLEAAMERRRVLGQGARAKTAAGE